MFMKTYRISEFRSQEERRSMTAVPMAHSVYAADANNASRINGASGNTIVASDESAFSLTADGRSFSENNTASIRMNNDKLFNNLNRNTLVTRGNRVSNIVADEGFLAINRENEVRVVGRSHGFGTSTFVVTSDSAHTAFEQSKIGNCSFRATVDGAAEVSPRSIQTMTANSGDYTPRRNVNDGYLRLSSTQTYNSADMFFISRAA